MRMDIILCFGFSDLGLPVRAMLYLLANSLYYTTVILKFKFHPPVLVFALPEKLFQILINLLYIYQANLSVFVDSIRVFGKPLDGRESYTE